MQLQFIDLAQLSVSKANMRYARKAPDVADLLPTIRKRGVIAPVLVRPVNPDRGVKAGGAAQRRANPRAGNTAALGAGPGACQAAPSVAQTSGPSGADERGNAEAPRFEVVAGARRFHAACLIARERREQGLNIEPMPCAVLDEDDDAAAVEASLIENLARRDADDMTQWETFVRLIREGQTLGDIAATFGLSEPAVRRVLALGDLLPRIRTLYREGAIDAASLRHLTLASKRQQRAWLLLLDDPDASPPFGHQLKSWLFGGQSIPVRHALFAIEDARGVVADLFGEDSYFSDVDAFWTAQNAAVDARRADYLAQGWTDVVVVPPSEHFHLWEHEKAPKRKGGRVYIDLRANGEAVFHEGYVTTREARRLARGEAMGAGEAMVKTPRPEMSGPMENYVDLHRHVAVRAALCAHPGAALRLMLAHAIVGSTLWSVRSEPQIARNDVIRESVELCRGETDFDASRRAVLAVLGFSPEEPTVVGGNGDGYGLASLYLRLLQLSDADIMNALAVVMGETLAAGGEAVEVLGQHLAIDMAAYWQADEAFLETLRDRETLLEMIAEVAGADVAAANAREKTRTLKAILRDALAGGNGRASAGQWAPRWMAFPPTGYTTCGGAGTFDRAARIAAARNALGMEAQGFAAAGEAAGRAPALPDELDNPAPLAA